MLSLSTPISQIGTIYSKTRTLFLKFEIETVGDLLSHVPSRYIDFSLTTTIDKVQTGETVSIRGTVESFRNIFTKYGKNIQEGIVSDSTGSIDLVWFNQTYLSRIIIPGTLVAFSGKVGEWKKRPALLVPEFEEISTPYGEVHENLSAQAGIHTGRLVPVYPETKGLSSKTIRRHIFHLLHNPDLKIPEFLPPALISSCGLTDERRAYDAIHFPEKLEDAEIARKRLSFDELFLLQLATLLIRQKREKKIKTHPLRVDPFLGNITQFISSLPFKLTSSQQKVSEEVLNDLKNPFPMNRILVGDVGSGKTLIAVIASFCACLNKLQTLVMAPTEILASQHFINFSKFFNDTKIKVGLLTGKDKNAAWNDDIIIGTHALLSKSAKFEHVGLIVIDEQQRFGVVQRAHLGLVNSHPHLLTMTATPIPRTIALTVLSDLDVSTLSEKPVGRKEIKTWVVPSFKRDGAYNWIRNQIITAKQNNDLVQAFVICPFIDLSENLISVKAANMEFTHLQKEIFPDLQIGILHGKMKANQKNEILTDFKKGKYDILVATPVVEVGIDIPTATIMMIETAERYGLSQLHQLRGRVGRNDQKSYCLLFTEEENRDILQRLKLLERIHDGPKLAEMDLKIRGPGNLYGTKQHGKSGLKIADFSNLNLIEDTRKAVKIFLSRHKNELKNVYLQERLKSYKIQELTIE